MAAARRGRRVLIVEIGEQERMPSIFGAARAGYAGAQVYGRGTPGVAPIWSMCLTAREALHEFAVRTVKFEVIYEAIFENRVMRYFTAAAPGLDDLTLLGKIESLHREVMAPTKRAKFDLMIFDAPATGHGLAFFDMPLSAMRMTRVGPLYEKVERMWRLLADPARTAFNIVTLPEEMSVNESIELNDAAEAMRLPRGKVVVNGVYPDVFADDRHEIGRLVRERTVAPTPSDRIARAIIGSARSVMTIRDAHDGMIDTLADRLPQPRVILPFLFRPRIGREEIETLADGLEAF